MCFVISPWVYPLSSRTTIKGHCKRNCSGFLGLSLEQSSDGARCYIIHSGSLLLGLDLAVVNFVFHFSFSLSGFDKNSGPFSPVVESTFHLYPSKMIAFKHCGLGLTQSGWRYSRHALNPWGPEGERAGSFRASCFIYRYLNLKFVWTTQQMRITLWKKKKKTNGIPIIYWLLSFSSRSFQPCPLFS